jgi:hypothetical protein
MPGVKKFIRTKSIWLFGGLSSPQLLKFRSRRNERLKQIAIVTLKVTKIYAPKGHKSTRTCSFQSRQAEEHRIINSFHPKRY